MPQREPAAPGRGRLSRFRLGLVVNLKSSHMALTISAKGWLVVDVQSSVPLPLIWPQAARPTRGDPNGRYGARRQGMCGYEMLRASRKTINERGGRKHPNHAAAFVMSAINRAFARSRALYCPHLREL